MKQLTSFLRLTRSEKCLLAQATMTLWIFRIGLGLIPFRTLHKWALKHDMSQSNSRPPTHSEPKLIIRAVNRAGKYLPGENTCLARALTGKVMFARNGYRVGLHIGVRKDSNGDFRAHAWVKHEGRVVIGGPQSEVDRYTPLQKLESITYQ